MIASVLMQAHIQIPAVVADRLPLCHLARLWLGHPSHQCHRDLPIAGGGEHRHPDRGAL